MRLSKETLQLYAEDKIHVRYGHLMLQSWNIPDGELAFDLARLCSDQLDIYINKRLKQVLPLSTDLKALFEDFEETQPSVLRYLESCGKTRDEIAVVLIDTIDDLTDLVYWNVLGMVTGSFDVELVTREGLLVATIQSVEYMEYGGLLDRIEAEAQHFITVLGDVAPMARYTIMVGGMPFQLGYDILCQAQRLQPDQPVKVLIELWPLIR